MTGAPPYSPSWQVPTVIRVAEEYRNRVDAREADTIRELTSWWQTAIDGYSAEIDSLVMEMDRRLQAGEEITQQILWRETRYRKLRDKAEERINDFNKQATGRIYADQDGMGMLGINFAQDAIRASYQDNVALRFPLLNVGAVEELAGFFTRGAALDTLLQQTVNFGVIGMEEALLKGMSQGLGMAEVARQMRLASSTGLDRAILIARTEMHRAYRLAEVNQYRKSRVVKGYFRLVKKATACLACLVKDGELYTVDEDFSDHPAGKCTIVPMVLGMGNSPSWQTGPEWLEAQTDDKQKEIMGEERWNAWRNHGVPLNAFAGIHQNSTWGDSPMVVPMRELRKIYNLPARAPRVRTTIQTGSSVLAAGKQPGGWESVFEIDTYEKAFYRKMEGTLARINEVHVFKKYGGELVAIHHDDHLDAYGNYCMWVGDSRPKTKRGQRVAINVRQQSNPHPELTLAHEVGHLVDYEIFGIRMVHPSGEVFFESGIQNRTSQEIKDVYSAITQTRTYGIWSLVEGDSSIDQNLRDYAAYLMQPNELFAKAYAQYIAKKTGDMVLEQQVQDMVNLIPVRAVTPVWEADEFEAIYNAMDKLIRTIQ